MSQSDFVSRGQALVASGQFQEAVKVCRLGLLGRPTTVEGRVVLGQALLALKRYDEVLAEMRVALELDHTSFAAQILRGEALLRKGDGHAAVEALQRARQLAPTDHRVLELLETAERSNGRPAVSASHPAVSFVGGTDSMTKNYPNHADGDDGEEDTGDDGEEDSFTKPTSLASPSAPRRRSSIHDGMPDSTPPPAVLEIGDKSGTVEVDPLLDGVEVGYNDEIDEVAAPPRAAKRGNIGGARGSVKSSRAADIGPPKRATAPKKRPPVVEVEDDDLLEARETRLPEPRGARKPGPGTAVRNAVAMPSGPLDQDPLPRAGLPAPLPPPGGRPKPASVQPMPMGAPPAVPLPPVPSGFPPPSVSAAGVPRGPIAAAMPTVSAMPAVAPPDYVARPPFSPTQVANAARPTMAVSAPPPPPMSAMQQQSAAAVDALFGQEQQAPSWARSTVVAGSDAQAAQMRSIAAANEPTARPGAQIDPSIQQLFAGRSPVESGAVRSVDQPMATPPKSGEMRTGMRKARSRFQVVMWVAIGVVVIGGGVFAGFQIRRIRLDKQIIAEREHATGLAKSDTWHGWTAARDSLAGIARASGTLENRAALARARALIAFEFGDGIVEAKAAVEGLAGQGGRDGDVAAAYLALAENDVKGAKVVADAAVAVAPKDAGALYIAGQTALAMGDTKAAISNLRAAIDREPRPLYSIALARALGATYAWDDAIKTIDAVLKANPDHPAAVITRGTLLAASGRIVPGAPLGNDVRAQLDKVVAEGAKAPNEQPHGVSPAQVAFADLALAQVDFARGDVNTARSDVGAAGRVLLDDQRFAEEAVDTLFLFGPGDLERTQKFAKDGLNRYPRSRRLKISLALIDIAQGKPTDALELLAKQPDLLALPSAQVVHGQASVAAGDLEGARTDFDAVLKKIPSYEPALVGRAWVDLAEGKVDDARKLIDPRYSSTSSSAALTTTEAALLRASGSRDAAKKLLEKVVAGPPGFDVARAQLELARIYRDAGDYKAALGAYMEASHAGSFEARLEGGIAQIDDMEPAAGRDSIDTLLKEAGDHPSTLLLLEAARARMLVGEHVGAAQLLDTAAKSPGVLQWKLDRERGRLALRKGDLPTAAAAFMRALDGCNDDGETFLLAADAASPDDAALVGKLKKLAPERLKGRPEAAIVTGKLLLAGEKFPEAEAAYQGAKKQIDAEKVAPRLQAQVQLGLAVAAYYLKDDPTARSKLELVIQLDPSLYNAYLFAAEINSDRQPAKALEYADRATTLDPDNVDAWASLGRIAHKLGDRKKLADAIGKLSSIAPQSEQLAELQKLRR